MAVTANATLVTGSTGLLGSLVVGALLHEEGRRLLLPIRAIAATEDCLRQIRLVLRDRCVPTHLEDELMELITIVELPSLDQFSDLDLAATTLQVDEIVHCAGCVDYFDTQRLYLANIALTERLLVAARSWNVRRFIYMSTAYCSGYRLQSIPESLHPEPKQQDEPTEYTRSKRIAEWLIADSGIPFLIIRPSIVIGHSRTGVYRGKNYGLYQLWRAVEGLLCREYSPIWYHVASKTKINFLHLDAFESGFAGVYRGIPSGAIVHLVSDHEKGPTTLELSWMWAKVYWPKEIRCYASIDDVPLHALPVRHRRFLQVVAKNLEIAGHTWEFEADRLSVLRENGLSFVDTTLETVSACQRQYIAQSPRIQEHMRKYAGCSATEPQLVEIAPPNDHVSRSLELRQ
jgi:nucleoside-diphosphate-sugar epimerase